MFFHLFDSYFLSILSADHLFVRPLISPETLPSLEPKVSSLPSPFTSNFFLEFPLSALDFEMGYSFLLDTPGSLAIFRQKFDIPVTWKWLTTTRVRSHSIEGRV